MVRGFNDGIVMGVEITTISVSPQNANGLQEVRDERDLHSMDAALGVLLKTERENTENSENAN